MKKQLSSLVAVLAVIALFASTAYALQTFTLANQTSHHLGTVTLHMATGSTTLHVSTGGTYIKEVVADINAVTINGQTLVKPLTGLLTVASGDTVVAGWSDGKITIIDFEEGL